MARGKGKTTFWAVVALLSISLNAYLMLHHSSSSVAIESKIQNPKSAIQYTCPMHPTILQDHAGTCPICGMDLVKMENAPSAIQTPPSAIQFTCPMHPTIIQDHAGTCPICGMDLVKMENTGSSGGVSDVPNRAEVTIDPTRQQLIGLRTAAVSRGTIRSDMKLVGRVAIDETRVRKVNVKVMGYVEKIFVDFVGKPVRQGDPLFSFYSPDLLTAQREYLHAFEAAGPLSDGEGSDAWALKAARQKLLLWDVTEEQINDLEKTGEVTKALTFTSPVSGVVTMKEIVEGSSLMPGETPYEITDYSTVWVMADGYQSDVAKIKVGAEAVVGIEALPEEAFEGKVVFIDPALDPMSRTFKIRINVANPNGLLKPDMFAEVLVLTPRREALVVPADAIIPSGRGSMVFVAMDGGRFQPRSVTVGEKSAELVEVVGGVMEGELVVTRANFLIDSESSLRAALAAAGAK